jgi:HTH-type transcriptional regulator/antitoxin HigA
MEIKPIKTAEDHDQALREIERLWGSPPGSKEADRLNVLAILVDNYEEEHYPMDPPDPIEAIKFRMEQEGLSRSALEPILGTRGRVAEVLNGRRQLSIGMIRRLHGQLHIPAEVLIREPARKYRVAYAAKKVAKRIK